MGQKSIIAGGKIYAQNGVKAYHIGTKMGVKTEINCGIDYSVQQKIEWIKDKTVALAFKLRRIEDGIKRKTSDLKKLNATRDKIKNTIHKMNEAAKSLIFQLDKSESAEIIAKGTVYPDVYIEICPILYLVKWKMFGSGSIKRKAKLMLKHIKPIFFYTNFIEIGKLMYFSKRE